MRYIIIVVILIILLMLIAAVAELTMNLGYKALDIAKSSNITDPNDIEEGANALKNTETGILSILIFTTFASIVILLLLFSLTVIRQED